MMRLDSRPSHNSRQHRSALEMEIQRNVKGRKSVPFDFQFPDFALSVPESGTGKNSERRNTNETLLP
jgi:hypothetical protein